MTDKKIKITRDSITITNAAGDEYTFRHQAYMGDSALLIGPGITGTVRLSQIVADPSGTCIDMGTLHLHAVMPTEQTAVADWVQQKIRARAL